MGSQSLKKNWEKLQYLFTKSINHKYIDSLDQKHKASSFKTLKMAATQSFFVNFTIGQHFAKSKND